MARENRINVRVGASHASVQAMAAALSTDAAEVSVSDVYRTLLAEAMTARARDCARTHQGPIKAKTCAHCGKEIK